MGYSVFLISSTKELISTIEKAFAEGSEDITVYGHSQTICIEDGLKQYNPDVIIIDYELGNDILKKYSEELLLLKKHPPALIAINCLDNSNFSEFTDAGFDDFIEVSKECSTIPIRVLMSINRQKKTNQLIEKSEQLNDISTAASKAGSSLLIIDKTGEIAWVNEGFEKLYECNLSEFSEKFGRNVFKLHSNSKTTEAMKKCLETGEYVVYDSIWFTNDNVRKNIQTSLTPIYDKSGSISKIIAIETDITDLKQAEEALSNKHDNLLSTMEHLEEANRLLDEQRREIENQKLSLEEEKNKSDALLLNILPEVAAHQLKKKGFVRPKKYNEVSVFFADFVNFSSLSVSYNTIEEFLAALSFYFENFDETTTKRFIEKIKTIGDCYMCVGGVPQINKSHPFDTVLAALEIQKLVEDKAAIDQANGLPVWRLRVGIHTGSVMAGVIGKKKFAYDVWGDTVNVASRMESRGEAGKVNISETTYHAIQDYFHCTYRGKVHAKNIGEINMYFVERILPEFSEDEGGYLPNAAFRKELAKY